MLSDKWMLSQQRDQFYLGPEAGWTLRIFNVKSWKGHPNQGTL